MMTGGLFLQLPMLQGACVMCGSPDVITTRVTEAVFHRQRRKIVVGHTCGTCGLGDWRRCEGCHALVHEQDATVEHIFSHTVNRNLNRFRCPQCLVEIGKQRPRRTEQDA